jgi:hypothetical protein
MYRKIVLRHGSTEFNVVWMSSSGNFPNWRYLTDLFPYDCTGVGLDMICIVNSGGNRGAPTSARWLYLYTSGIVQLQIVSLRKITEGVAEIVGPKCL